MIKRLKGKFIFINMVIVTLMICVILGLVYHIMKRNIEADSIIMMQNIAGRPDRRDVPSKPEQAVSLPYFTIEVGPDGEAATGGYYDLSDEAFIDDLVGEVMERKKPFGMIEAYNLRYYHMPAPGRQRFVFVDASNELATLKNLMRICFLIGGLSFLVFLWISILLSRWVVKPIELAWKQQRQFIADASHELKTPLTVIMTNAELLDSSGYNEDDKGDCRMNILVMSRQMRKLIEQMLELARTDSIQEKLVFAPVDFSKLVSDAALPFEPVFFEKGLALTTEVEEHIHVNGDSTGLRQTIEILLDNAGKYSKEHGTICLSLKKQGKRQCILSLSNEGDEIPPDELGNIFKRFYRADEARSSSGSFGLGLSIAANIVKRHKGKIWAESKEGVNTFYVKLPCI